MVRRPSVPVVIVREQRHQLRLQAGTRHVAHHRALHASIGHTRAHTRWHGCRSPGERGERPASASSRAPTSSRCSMSARPQVGYSVRASPVLSNATSSQRAHGACDRPGERLPAARLDGELRSTFPRQRVEARPPVRVGHTPRRRNPAAFYQTMERGIQRSLLHKKNPCQATPTSRLVQAFSDAAQTVQTFRLSRPPTGMRCHGPCEGAADARAGRGRQTPTCARRGTASLERERQLDGHEDRHRNPILHGGRKPPLPDSGDCRLVEVGVERALDLNSTDRTIR